MVDDIQQGYLSQSQSQTQSPTTSVTSTPVDATVLANLLPKFLFTHLKQFFKVSLSRFKYTGYVTEDYHIFVYNNVGHRHFVTLENLTSLVEGTGGYVDLAIVENYAGLLKQKYVSNELLLDSAAVYGIYDVYHIYEQFPPFEQSCTTESFKKV